MLQKTRGIVLRTVKYAESSVICKIYTREFGLQSYLINSIRTSKAKTKQSLLQPASLLDMVVYHSKQKNLQRVSELKRSFIFRSIPFDIRKASISLFMIEVVHQAIREEESNKALFDFIHSRICELDKETGKLPFFHIHFMLDLCRYLGFYPNGKYSDHKPFFDLMEGSFVSEQPSHNYFLTPAVGQVLSQLLGKIKPLPDRIAKKDLLDGLTDYYRLHLTHFKQFNSQKILEEVLRKC